MINEDNNVEADKFAENTFFLEKDYEDKYEENDEISFALCIGELHVNQGDNAEFPCAEFPYLVKCQMPEDSIATEINPEKVPKNQEEKMIDTFLWILQKWGLQQFHPLYNKRGILHSDFFNSVEGWHGDIVYGTYAEGKTKYYEELLAALNPQITSVFTDLNIDDELISDIAKKLAHCVMLCLLSSDITKEIESFKYFDKDDNPLYGCALGDQYDSKEIAEFVKQYKSQNPGFSFKSCDENQKAAFSAFLASRVAEILEQINIETFIQNFYADYQKQIHVLTNANQSFFSAAVDTTSPRNDETMALPF